MVRLSYTTSPRRPLRQRSRTADVGMLAVFLAIAAAVAAFGTIATIREVDEWYSRVPHVTWTPPNWAFGPVWTLLYAMIAVSGWLLWRQRDRSDVRAALTLYVAQLVVNSVWTPVFFGGYPLLGPAALWLGVAVILLLDLLVLATIGLAWPVSRAAALLLVPYLVWILYASTLNWGDAVLIGLV